MASPTQRNIDPTALNLQARAIVLGNSVEMTQPLPALSVNPANQNVVNFQARNVGLLIGFIVEVTGTISNPAGAIVNRTPFGTANILTNIKFTDIDNLDRINTTGRHLAMVNAAKNGFPFGSAMAPNIPMGFGANFSPFIGPATIAAAATQQVRHVYHVPVAYSKNDLRGSVFSAVTNGVQNLQLTINPTPQVDGATDVLNAVYSGNAGGAWTGNVTINVYQVFRDQLPTANGSPILPLQDLNTVYDLKTTTRNGLTVGTDFPVPYSNQRTFLSTLLTYDNGGVYNGGSDINYFSLVAANTTPLWKVSPEVAALMARQTFMCDPPLGVYYFDHRAAPIDTINWGNLDLIVNPLTVNAGAKLELGYEQFTQANTITAASSLSS